MAFNPFNFFRKNQKVIFSVLVVIIMFMFVLSFGRGDFFDAIPRWLGSKSRSGDVMAVVDGSKVYQSDLEKTRERRVLANLYMFSAGQRASENIRKAISDGLVRTTAENKRDFQAVLAARPMYVSPQLAQILQQPALFEFYMQNGLINPERIAREREATIGSMQNRMTEIATAKNPKENDLDVATLASNLISLDVALASGRAGHYFTNQPNGSESYKDAMEFTLWLKKADQLGIKFTPEDVVRLANAEFLDRVTTDDWKVVESEVKGKRGFSRDALFEALGDEFRVRAAQAAVLGRNAVRPDGRRYDAPYDFYSYYREQCTPARIGMIAVPAENYLGDVTAKPNESELREIFNKAKGVEPDPRYAKPGLREPRKLKLEWLEAKGDEKFYLDAADDAARKSEVHAKLAGFLIAPGSAFDLSTVLTGPAFLQVNEPLLQAKYQEYVSGYRSNVQSNWYTSPFFGAPKPLDSAVLKPVNAGALLSAIAGAYGSGASPFTGPSVLVGAVAAADRKARLDTLPASVIVPAGPGFAATILATAAAQHLATQPLPLAAVKADLVVKAKDDLARTICNLDLTKFQEELTKLGAKADKSEAKAAVEKFVKERGLKTGQSTEFRDQFAIGDDPGLKPIKDRKEASDPFHGGFTDPVQFGRRFFFEQDPLTGQPAQSTGFYKPQTYPQFGLFSIPSKTESAALVWRVAEQPAESPRDFNAPGVKEKAEAAWRRAKARELAKEAAEKLAKQCDGAGKSSIEIYQKVADLRTQFTAKFPTDAARDRVRYFEIDNVAPITSTPLPQAGRSQVGPFTLAPSANLPYPTRKTAEDIVALAGKPLSTSIVVTDNTEDTYYVAVLTSKAEKSADEFGLMVYGPSSTFGDLGPVVSRRHQDDIRKQAREEAIALLKAEFRYDKESEKVNKKGESLED